MRLEQIATEVKDKETPLEKCLDLLEEGVSVANRCTELLDHTEWRSVVEGEEEVEETILAVPGMHCAGCIAKIEGGTDYAGKGGPLLGADLPDVELRLGGRSRL